MACEICGQKMMNCDCTDREQEMHERIEELEARFIVGSLAPTPDYDQFTDDPDNGPFYGAWCIVWSMPFSSSLRLASGFADQEEAEAEAERRRENHNQIIWRVCSCDELTGLDQIR